MLDDLQCQAKIVQWILKIGDKMKRTCGRCRALEYNCTCDLGFKTKKVYCMDVAVNAKPEEECPKPLTYAEYITCRKNRKFS